jgi:3-deoxy-D-manno-octulosonic-acid transferase
VRLLSCCTPRSSAGRWSPFKELTNTIDELLEDENYLTECSEKAGEFVKNNKGATEKIMNYLDEKLKTV